MPDEFLGKAKMEIARAEECDREAWLELRLALWPECEREASSKEITDVLESGRQAAFLARDDEGTAVGFVEVSTRDYVEGCSSCPVGYVEGIYVHHEHRSKGIGRELIRAAERWAHEGGCVEMGSDTRLDDRHSIAFHEALRFREMDRQVVFLKRIAGKGVDT